MEAIERAIEFLANRVMYSREYWEAHTALMALIRSYGAACAEREREAQKERDAACLERRAAEIETEEGSIGFWVARIFRDEAAIIRAEIPPPTPQ